MSSIGSTNISRSVTVGPCEFFEPCSISFLLDPSARLPMLSSSLHTSSAALNHVGLPSIVCCALPNVTGHATRETRSRSHQTTSSWVRAYAHPSTRISFCAASAPKIGVPSRAFTQNVA